MNVSEQTLALNQIQVLQYIGKHGLCSHSGWSHYDLPSGPNFITGIDALVGRGMLEIISRTHSRADRRCGGPWVSITDVGLQWAFNSEPVDIPKARPLFVPLFEPQRHQRYKLKEV